MKKLFVILGAGIFLIGTVVQSSALLRKDRDYYTGEIISVDTAANTIKIMDLNSRIERTFKVESGLRPELVEGTDVWFNVLKGTNIAKGIRVIEVRQKLVNPNKLDFFMGKIISVNKEENKITIMDYNSRIERTFSLQKKWRAELKKDKEVVVHAEKGTKLAKTVRVVKNEPAEKTGGMKKETLPSKKAN